jgi:hypothetical protein
LGCERAAVTRWAIPCRVPGSPGPERSPQASREGREYRTEPEAREERTGLAGAGVALRWGNAGRHHQRAPGAAHRSDTAPTSGAISAVRGVARRQLVSSIALGYGPAGSAIRTAARWARVTPRRNP